MFVSQQADYPGYAELAYLAFKISHTSWCLVLILFNYVFGI